MGTTETIKIGYHASHEQFSPSALLKFAKLAAANGFNSINSSDHFYPWSERQGQSGYSFSWLGAAMQAVDLPFGLVCAPGGRYHPAIVAQAIATLGELFPGRLTVALGSGEALNEAITGEIWPDKEARNARLLTCANIIRDLLDGKTVTYEDALVKVVNAKLYTLPQQKPLLIGAALSEATAAWMGTWADGLITVAKPPQELEKIISAFKNNGGADKPIYLKVAIAYAHEEDEALQGAHDQWRNNIFQGTVLAELRSVAQFDALGELVKPDDLYGKIRISSSLQQHLDWLKEDIALGVNHIILHQVTRNQELFIEDFGREVLPKINMP